MSILTRTYNSNEIRFRASVMARRYIENLEARYAEALGWYHTALDAQHNLRVFQLQVAELLGFEGEDQDQEPENSYNTDDLLRAIKRLKG